MLRVGRVGIALLSALQLGREVLPLLPALPAARALGQRLVPCGFTALGAVMLCLANK